MATIISTEVEVGEEMPIAIGVGDALSAGHIVRIEFDIDGTNRHDILAGIEKCKLQIIAFLNQLSLS